MPQKLIKVLVGSAGTASSINIIKSLKKYSKNEYYIHAIDCDHLAPGLFLADGYSILPPFKETEKYLSELEKLQKKYNFDLFLPTYSKELEFIAEQKTLLAKLGIKTLISSPETIRLCNNKFAMNNAVKSLGVLVPRMYSTKEVHSFRENQKLVVKPNTGSSSSGLLISQKLNEVCSYFISDTEQICQEFISGVEYTVDVFCDKKNVAKVISVRSRLSVKAGQVVKSRLVDPNIFRDVVQLICSHIHMIGVCNIQFIKSKSGELYFIELNPRFAAGGLMLTTASGANIPELMVKMALDITISDDEYNTKTGLTMTRYWEEIIRNE